MRVAGFFAGIGGLELGLRDAGHQTSFLCEVDSGCRAVLAKRFDVDPAGDIRRVRRLPDVDLVAAGFPCQDISQAGRCRGLDGGNSGLVYDLLDLVKKSRERPPWILLENVKFLLHLDHGSAMRVILDRLERLGYRWAYRVVDSRAFGLPQRRERVFILASNVGQPEEVLLADDRPAPESPGISMGFYWTEGNRGLGRTDDAVPALKAGSTVGIPSPPAIWLPDGRIVTPDIRDAERLQGFRENWTKPAEPIAGPRARWRLVGNAVSVPVARWIGQRLAKPGAAPQSLRLMDKGDALSPAAWGNRKQAWVASVGQWPVKRRFRPIHEFLKFPPAQLSLRATSGFRGRFVKSRLRRPDGFLKALREHIDEMAEVAD